MENPNSQNPLEGNNSPENTPSPINPNTPKKENPWAIRPIFYILLIGCLAGALLIVMKKQCYAKKHNIQTIQLHLEMPSTIRFQSVGGKSHTLQVHQTPQNPSKDYGCQSSCETETGCGATTNKTQNP
jgi:hypothetical protein